MNGPSALDQAARAAMARRDAGAAQSAVQALTGRFPTYAPGWLTASVLALDLGRTAEALAAADRALALAPGQAALLIQRLRCLAAAMRTAEAQAAAVAAEAAVGDDQPRLQHELGNALSLLGEHARAAVWLRRAAERTPDDPALQFNLATVLRFLGQFAEAEDLLDAAIAARPDDWEAWGARSQLRTQTPARNHVAAIGARLAPPPADWRGEVQLRYALAKEQEDLGRPAEAFVQVAAGAALRRARLRYDVGEDVAAMDRIAQVFDRAWLDKAAKGPASPAPIFVFGLPRSGTTLVERILGRHPEVVSLGELNDLPIAVSRVGAALGGGDAAGKARLIDLAAQAPDRIGAAYLERVAPLAGAAPRFIDKLPMNYLYAGLIAAGLPGARLVEVRRHPMASGYAMFKTLFNQGYPFSYDLDDLGRYIAAFLRLSAHWRATLGERLVSIAYEDLVADQPGQTRRLVEGCGLAWDEACLAPQDNPAPSSTHSAVQVRRPVYAHAVDQWRAHAEGLAPLARRLGTEGVVFD